MKILINNISSLLDDKLSLRQRGLLVSIMLLKDKDPKVWDAKCKTIPQWRTECKPDLMDLHERGFIEWKGYKQAKKKVGHSETDQQVAEVIKYYNQVTGRNVKWTTEHQVKNLRARLNEGSTVEDCFKVIANRYEEWNDDPMMSKHLYPSTLFRPTKFPNYLAEANRTKVGVGRVRAEAQGISHGDEITIDMLDALEDKSMYLIKTYRTDEHGSRRGNGFKGTRNGASIKRTIRAQQMAINRGEPREFIYVYLNQ